MTSRTKNSARNPADNESICARCAREKGEVCCEVAPGQKLATLTLTDIARIEESTGLPSHRFVEREILDPAERIAYETFRPVYRGLFVDNIRYGLKAKKGACVFLRRGMGCELPQSARPLACKIYPIDFDLAGEPTLLDAPHCLALEEASSGPHLLRMLGLTRKRLGELYGQALSEGAQHAAGMRRQKRACNAQEIRATERKKR